MRLRSFAADVLQVMRESKPLWVLSAVLSVLATLCLHIKVVDPDNISEGSVVCGTWSELTFTPFGAGDIFAFVFFCCVIAVVVSICATIARRGVTKAFMQPSWPMWKIGFVSALLMLLCWLPYLLTYYPGGLYSDTTSPIMQALGKGFLSNQHTMLYTFVWWLCFSLAGVVGLGSNAALCSMMLLQAIAMASACAYCMVWLMRKGLSRNASIVAQAFFMLFPLLPLNAVSLWKDTLFSVCLLLYALLCVDICMDPELCLRGKTVARYVVLALLVAFTRNNGVYIVLATSIVVAGVMLWRKTSPRRFVLPVVFTLLVTLVIQGPVYAIAGVSQPFFESLGIPLQQIARTITYEGDALSQEQSDYFYSILPKDKWVELYHPFLVDTIKWDSGFESAVIERDKGRFFTECLKLGMEHPDRYLEAAMMACAGFWNPAIGTTENVAYYQVGFWGVDSFEGAAPVDILQTLTGISLYEALKFPVYLSPALFVWVMLLSISVMIVNGDVRVALGLAPLVLLWLTLMVATPIAYSLRYCFVLVMATPLFVFLPRLGHAWHEQLTSDVGVRV